MVKKHTSDSEDDAPQTVRLSDAKKKLEHQFKDT